MLYRCLVVAGAFLFVAPAGALLGSPNTGGKTEPVLSAEDRTFLQGLLGKPFFDPRGAQRVRVKVLVRSVWGGAGSVERDGWLVPAQGKKPPRVYLIDGASIPAPPDKELQKVDFLAMCRARLASKPQGVDDPERRFERMRQTALGAVDESTLVLAVWLHRLGEDGLAAQALAQARKADKDGLAALRQELAWSAFAGLVHAYMVAADEEALAHGERLLRLYPAEAAKHFAQGKEVVQELQRRKKRGTFGKVPAEKWPADFERWDGKQKAAYLIDALDEVNARQTGQPGGVDLASDRRVKALIDLGDIAVPALIDAVDKDTRLTRSVHFWRDFAQSRTVLGVSEAALAAVMSILRVRVFEPAATGDNFTARGKEGAKTVADGLRAYWKEYGGLPFDKRMMKVLTDPKCTPESWREAAANLAALGEERTLSTTVFSDRSGGRPKRPNPAIARFQKPTTAEAILAAMDRDLLAWDARPKDDMHDYYRRGFEDAYLYPLIELDDRRAAPELARRARAAADGRMRRKWAYAAHWLGEAKPLAEFADDFRLGKIPLAANNRKNANEGDQPGNVELRGIIGYLAQAGTPACDRALFALADPKHPGHQLAARRVLKDHPDWSDSAAWFAHPYCLAILRRALDDVTPTGGTFKIQEGALRHEYKGGSSSGPIPEILADATTRRPEVSERVCDTAAAKLSGLVLGLPVYHPLFKDAEARLRDFRAAFDRFRERYRRATWREAEAVASRYWLPVFLPDLGKLERAATAEDVKAGRAVFHLDGKGKRLQQKLPASAILKRDVGKEYPQRLLIVQAEAGPDGAVTYAVIEQHAIRAVPAADLAKVEPLGDKGE
jgi:hypothetical protein